MAVGVFASLLPAACMSAETAKAPETVAAAGEVPAQDVLVEGAPVPVGASFVGNYLAGRHAQAQRDGAKAIEYFRLALEEDPENTDLMLRAAVVMISEGAFADAVIEARKLESRGADNSVVEYTLAVDDIAAGRFAEAGERLAVLPENGINRYVGAMLRAWALVGLGDVDGARSALAELKRGEGTNALSDLHEALIQDLTGRRKEAGEAFERALAGDGGLAFRAVDLYGAFLERTGEPMEARRVYQGFLAEHPESYLLQPAMARLEAGRPPAPDIASAADGAAQALFDLAGAFRQQNAQEMALVLGRLALALKPDFAVAQFLVGDILETSERQESANQVYASIKADSPFARAANIRMALNLNAMDRTEQAVALLRKMARENPKDPEPLITLGNVLRGHQRFVEAVEIYDQAVTRVGPMNKQHWSLLYSRGMALERSKQWPRAEKDFLKALEYEPEQPYVLNYLGYSWVDMGLHLDRAMEMIRKAVQLRPNDGYIVDSLGWALYRLGDIPGAVRELERAVELRPEDPVINDHLGDAYWKAGRRQEARFQWRRSLGFEPEADLIAAIEKKLKTGVVEDKAPGRDG
ncbi:tetratricopeptide repeat protein [Shumkonia mesophila]|uniref:tetratricopeptide repeat protein n=1 Tax=Shumkonia mesophila TaxID=2838854 RepID=UPI0029342211|nr:tetratricopeptide repeat protein [Shumkonia mesophila]